MGASVPKHFLVVLVLVILAGCGDDQNTPVSVPTPSPVTPSVEPVSGADLNHDTRTAAAQRAIAATAEAKTYLEQATAAAQARHRTATQACVRHPEPQVCGEAADEGLQTDLQAARAQFDEQMTEVARQHEVE